MAKGLANYFLYNEVSLFRGSFPYILQLLRYTEEFVKSRFGCITKDFPAPSNRKIYGKGPGYNETWLEQPYFVRPLVLRLYRGILVYNICLISISNSVSDGTTNKSVLNIESS